MMPFGTDSNLDLAQMLFDLGGVQFGSFDLPGTAGASPIYVNPRVLISEPRVLRRIGRLINAAIASDRARVRPHLASFAAVAGVPMGGLHIATAYALESDTPLVFLHRQDGDILEGRIEGSVMPGQTVLVMDDLMTGGSSILAAANRLEAVEMRVRDAIVLIDREQGGVERLKENGYNVRPILGLNTMLNFYHSNQLIDDQTFERCVAYLSEFRKPRDHNVNEEYR
jgi:orotate phosphoribosyltransferase/uridine monophosphate synthetase